MKFVCVRARVCVISRYLLKLQGKNPTVNQGFQCSYLSFTVSWILPLKKENTGKKKRQEASWSPPASMPIGRLNARPLLRGQPALVRTVGTDLVRIWLDDKLFFIFSVIILLCIELSYGFSGDFVFTILLSIFTLSFQCIRIRRWVGALQ